MFLGDFFNQILYYPLFNALILIYNYLPGHNLGLAIVLLTIIIRLIFYPLSTKALHSQKALQGLQSKVKEIERKYKGDKEGQARETLELYRREKINPFSGILLTLVQLPILIALYHVFWKGLKSGEISNLYPFIENPGSLNLSFLGLLNLSEPSIILAILAGVVQFIQTKMIIATPKDRTQAKSVDINAMVQKQMVYIFPVITVIILFRLPSALGLYWIVGGIFSIIQQYFVLQLKKEDTTLTQ